MAGNHIIQGYSGMTPGIFVLFEMNIYSRPAHVEVVLKLLEG